MVIQGIKYPSDFEAKKAMIEVAKRLNEKGYAIGGDGSLSVRVGPNAIWITVAGADKGALAQDMMVRIDMNGKQMMSANPRQLPDDLTIHLNVYAENSKVQCVTHTYPPMANVMAICGINVESAGFSPAVRAMGSVQVIDASNKDAAAQKVALLCKTENGVLLQNDGCMFWGTTVMEAFHRVEAVEYYAKVTSKLEGRMSVNSYVSNTTPLQTQIKVQNVTVSDADVVKINNLNGVTSIVKPMGKSYESPKPATKPKPATISYTTRNQESNTPVMVKDAVMQEVVRRVMMNLSK